jgi:hypothetical protein
MPNGNTQLTTIAANLPFVLPNRGGFNYSTKELDNAFTLESVRDRLARQKKAMMPITRTVDLNRLNLVYDNGTILLRRRVGEKFSTPVPLHVNAWRQLYNFVVTPTTSTQSSRSLVEFLLRDSTHQDASARKLGVMTVNFLLQNAGEKPIVLHVANRKIDENSVVKYIRGITSTNYVQLSNLDYVKSLLEVPELRDRKVVMFKTDDKRLYLRTFMDSTEGKLELNKPYRTFDGWNGETGHRSYGGAAGLYRLVCENGMTTNTIKDRYTFAHVGSTPPGQKIRGVLNNILERGSVMQKRYEKALSHEIDNAFEVMESFLSGETGISYKSVEGTRIAMLDDTSSKYGTLANIIDGITLHAQSIESVEGRETLERAADKILLRVR